jgi:phosphonate transport system substrate-binding protein
MKLRRFILFLMIGVMIGVVVSCADTKSVSTDKLTIGVVSYGEAEVSLEPYQRFQNYLAEQTKIAFELEIAYNELQAVQQVESGNWSLVFAPPGLAVIAGKRGFVQLFPLDDVDKSEHSLIVVLNESPVETLYDLANQTVAMGKPGSAAGYYLPLYDLYGLTLKEVKFAPTPETLLEWVDEGTVMAGAISEKDFNQYKKKFSTTDFRILHQSKRTIPAGVVLLGVVERGQGEFIRRVMETAPSNLTSDARYIPTASLPDYGDMVKVVDRVRPLEEQVRQQPAVLTLEHLGAQELEAQPSDIPSDIPSGIPEVGEQ